MSNSAIKTVDPNRVAAGRPIHCPYCGHAASAEPVAGRKGFSRKRVICTNIDCNRLQQRVEINDETGEAKTIDEGAPKKLFTSKRGRKPSGKTCAIEGCGRGAMAKGLCRTHYQRWLGCGKPDMQQWLAVGGPSKKQWLAIQPKPIQEPDDAEHDREDADEPGLEPAGQAGGDDDGTGIAASPRDDGPERIGSFEQDGDPASDLACDRGDGPVCETEPAKPCDISDAGEAGEPVPSADPPADDAVGDVEPRRTREQCEAVIDLVKRDLRPDLDCPPVIVRDEEAEKADVLPSVGERALGGLAALRHKLEAGEPVVARDIHGNETILTAPASERWIDADLSEIVHLPPDTDFVVCGVIGSHRREHERWAAVSFRRSRG